MKKILIVPVAAALMFGACGRNPFGPGAPGGLDLFAKFAKAMGKPSAIHEEENNKDGSKNTLSQAAAKRRLAKGASGQFDPGVDSAWLQVNGSIVTYVELITDKPSEEDSGKTASGRAEIDFQYAGTFAGLTLANINLALVTDIYRFHFEGREKKAWNDQEDTLWIVVNFAGSGLANKVPDSTYFWGKVLVASKWEADANRPEGNRDDSASFMLGAMVGDVQSGHGGFYDARTGEKNDGPSQNFEFDINVIHKGTPGNYADNEGVVTFHVPWGKSDDELYFMIHFYPGEIRKGEIRKNGINGALLVEFENNDKTGEGSVVYHEENN